MSVKRIAPSPGLAALIVAVSLAFHLTATGGTVSAEQIAAQELETTTGKKTVRILGIGNSFLRNATGPLHHLVRESGHEMVLLRAAPGGCTLERHMAMANLHEEDPDTPEGKPYTHRGQRISLKEALLAEKWDYVTIQQSSPNSFKIETYRPHAQNLCDYISKHAPDAEIVFHQTWAYRMDSKRLYNEEFGQFEMYRGLTRAYRTIAREVEIEKLIPVGDAFQIVAESEEWAFQRDPDFDYDDPAYPNLPAEMNSLNRGWTWRRGGDDGAEHTFRLDAQHANAAGKYLGALVWFEFFFGDDARGLAFKPEEVDEEFAAFLRRVAHRVVAEGARPAAWPEDLE